MEINTTMHKLIENGMRRFQKHLTRPQMKAVKSVTRGIIRKTTTILSALNEDAELTNRKYRERISYHLGNIDLVDEVEAKGFACARETKEVKGYFITSYDESDIFKPDAKKMPGLKRVRDGSTGQTGMGYLMRGVNINGISVYSRLEEYDENKVTKSDYIIDVVKHVQTNMKDKKLLFVMDRGGDCIDLIDDLGLACQDYLIRGKTNRCLIDMESGKRMKITDFKLGKTQVWMEGGTALYVWKIERPEFDKPIILYTNVETFTGEECLELYLKRWKIEEDFRKSKELGLEDVRLFSMKKVSNIFGHYRDGACPAEEEDEKT